MLRSIGKQSGESVQGVSREEEEEKEGYGWKFRQKRLLLHERSTLQKSLFAVYRVNQNVPVHLEALQLRTFWRRYILKRDAKRRCWEIWGFKV